VKQVMVDVTARLSGSRIVDAPSCNSVFKKDAARQ
jgi:hypothetical protein